MELKVVARAVAYFMVLVGGALVTSVFFQVSGLFGVTLCGSLNEKIAFSFFHLWIGVLIAQAMFVIEQRFGKDK